MNRAQRRRMRSMPGEPTLPPTGPPNGNSESGETITIPGGAGESAQQGFTAAQQEAQQVQQQQQGRGGRVFTEEEVEAIRRQEKEKLYGRIDTSDQRLKEMQDQLKRLEAEREDAIKRAEEQARKDAEERKAREFEELSAKELIQRQEQEWQQRLQQTTSEWETRLAEIEQQRAASDALLEKERALQAVSNYKAQRMAEEQENIIPELLPLITGNTVEEVDESINVLRDRSFAILQSIQQASAAQPPQRLRGAPVTAPPVGPLENQTEQQTMTADDIRNMTMEQYSKMRERLLQARPGRGR